MPLISHLMPVQLVVTTGAIRCAKLQSNSHHLQTNIQFLQAGCPSCRPTNSVKALKGKTATAVVLDHRVPWWMWVVDEADIIIIIIIIIIRVMTVIQSRR